MSTKRLFYIDLFCGAGGTSTGVERAMYNGEKCAEVIACVNHDKNAIASHAANHPNALHFTEDIRTLDLTELVAHTNKKRSSCPDSLVVLWASLECTNFSKAKGGQPRDADSRTLAEHLFRYIEALDPDYIYIENVEEFMCWGYLDENGKPVSKDKGRLYMHWVRTVCKYGYDFSHRLLNSANYGAYTSRTRFFGIFAKKNLPIVFPEPTHCKNGKQDMFNDLQAWKSVKEVLELEDEGKSIFDREKPLVDRTLERIYAGLIKFVAGGKDAFLVKYNSMGQGGKYTPPSIDEPCPTVATQNRLGVAKVQFLSKQFGGDPNGKSVSVNEPCGTITTIDHHAVVSAQFLDAYYGNGHEHSIDLPAPTLTTVDRLALVTSHFIDEQYGNGTPSGIDRPANTITTTPKHNLVQVERFLMNPSYTSSGGSVDNPCFTLVARMDKVPPYLVTTEKGEIEIVVYDTDSPAMRKIKEFMAMYGITDIKMRMLNVGELKRIMGFGSDYTLIGTQAEQKKYIGNAVEVNMAMALCVALYKEISQPSPLKRSSKPLQAFHRIVEVQNLHLYLTNTANNMEIDKIYNMDCLEGMKQIPDGSVDLIVTDPPYEFETRGSGFHKKRDYYDEIAAQGLAAGITEEYLVEMERVMKATNIYLFCNKNQLRMYFNFYKDKNCDLLVWHKLNPIPVVNNKYLSDLEYIFFARDKGVKLGGGIIH